MRFLLFALLLSACGKADNEPNELTPHERIAKKQAFYKSEAYKAQDEDRTVLWDECDSWHFTALEWAVTDTPAKPELFLDKTGKLQRRSSKYVPCYPGSSGSESTKEMYVYGSLYALKRGDRAWVEDRYDYGFKHQWVMGFGEPWRTILLPDSIAVLAQAIDGLGGAKHAERLIMPQRPQNLKGYEAFIQAVGVTFQGARFGAITDKSREAVVGLATRNPRNAMYACLSARWADGDLSRAQNLLLDEKVYPEDRLPNSGDYCERWITQRDDDDSKAWTPCPEEGKTHPAGAFLLAAAICQGEI